LSLEPHQQEQAGDSKFKLFSWISISLGLGLVGWIVYWADWQVVGGQLREVGGGIFLLFAVFGFAFSSDTLSAQLTYKVMPLTWKWYARFWLIRLIGEAANLIFPGAGMAGEPIKAAILKKQRIRYRDTVASFVLSKVTMLGSLILFLLISAILLLFQNRVPEELVFYGSLGLGVLTVLTGLAGIAIRYRWATKLYRRHENWSALLFLGRMQDQVIELESKIRFFVFYSPGRFFGSLAAAFVPWVMCALEIYVALLLIDKPVTFAEAWLVEAAAQLVRALTFFIPASMGALDAAFVSVCTLMFGSPEIGVTLAVLRRVREIFWTVLGFAEWGRLTWVGKSSRPIGSG